MIVSTVVITAGASTSLSATSRKAGVRRRRRANDHVEIEISGMAFEPLPAVVAGLVDDDRQSANADRAEAIESVIDQRTSSDRHHWLADAKPVRTQAASLACGNDASLQRSDVRMSGSLQNLREIAQVSHRGLRLPFALPWPGRPAGAIQMKRMPMRRAPSRSRRNKSPMKTVFSGVARSLSSAARKIAGIGLLGADAMAVHHHFEKRAQAGAFAHRFKIAVKIRHDAESIALAQRLQHRPIAFERGRRFRQEA